MNMKSGSYTKFGIWGGWLWIICLFCTCKQDEPFTAKPVNEALISGLDSVYLAMPGTVLQLNPQIKFTHDDAPDSSRYRYEWFYINLIGFVGSVGTDNALIDTTRQLNYSVDQFQGAYNMLFRVTDRKTGLFTEKPFRVYAANEVYEGWMILSEKGEQAQLDMLSYRVDSAKYVRIDNVLDKYQPQTQLQGHPVSIAFSMATFFSMNLGGMIIGTTTGIDAYDGDLFRHVGSFQDYLPAGVEVNWGSTSYDGRLQTAILAGNGKAYIAGNGQMEYTPDFKTIDAVADINGVTSPIHVAPWIAVTKSFPYRQSMVIYDEIGKEFLWIGPQEGGPAHRFGEGRLFNFKTGKELLYLGYTEKEGGQFAAVLRDPGTGSVFLARFSLYDQFYYEQIDAPGIGDAEHFAVRPGDGALFYAIGNKLFAIDDQAKAGREIMQFGANQISKIKFNSFIITVPTDISYVGTTSSEERYNRIQDQLIVCTFNPADPDHSGALHLFDIDAQQFTVQERLYYDGFPKIIDVAYKER